MKRFLTLSNLRLAVEILLILAVLAAVLYRFIPTRAAAFQAPDAPAAAYWYVCNGPSHIGLFTNRVHIFCTTTTPVAGAPTLSSIYWFAVPTATDSAAASRFMSLLQTATITAKPIWLQVDPNDTSGTSFGCGASDCRRIYGMEMR